MHVARVDPASYDAYVPALAALLLDVVRGGASVGFLADLTPEAAGTWWASALADPAALTWVARDEDGVVGVVRLVLDTETGSPAESLYARWGWQRVGEVPDYAASPDGRLAPTTFFTKSL